MPYPTRGAQWASDRLEGPWRDDSTPQIDPLAGTDEHTPEREVNTAGIRRGHMRQWMPRPIAMLVAAFLVAFLLPLAMPAPQAEAANCGTNWTSTTTPPSTIRVLLSEKNRVVVADFRSYVSMVMASGEFPSWLPRAVLETGATAVKQYGWYYAMQGHHRSAYKTESGVCYDVRNDTMDQQYKTVAHPTSKQIAALNATWGLTLRKSQKFFLTGYRAGVKSACAADADGWRIYAKSVIDCAEKGWDRQKIQARYYAPNVSFVWHDAPPPPHGDHTPPTVSVPEVRPAVDQSNPGHVRVTVSWSGTDDSSGITSYHLQERTEGGTWHAVTLPSRKTTSIQVVVQAGVRHQFRVKSRDEAGNVTGWIKGVGFIPTVSESDGAHLVGAWAESKDTSASGGATRTTRQKGATATLHFEGSSIGVMASVGPGMGKARVSIDGVVVDVIDLSGSTERHRRVVYSHTWSTTKFHTITVEALGTDGRPRVNVDAFVLLR